jgi:peptide/nickel transport system permease protein
VTAMGALGTRGRFRVPRQGIVALLIRAGGTRRGRIGLLITCCVVLLAAIGPLVAPHSPTEIVSTAYAKPSSHLWLGTDTLGRDALSRVLHGGWLMLVMAVVATVTGVALGTVAGVCAAYRGGWTDTVIMRTADVILAFPQLVFALLLVSLMGPRLWLIVVSIAVSHGPQVARVMYSATVRISDQPFIKARELNGVHPLRIMLGDIVPNLASPIVVELGLRLTFSIIVMAGLSFLGFGQPPPDPNWGYMISENRLGLGLNPWGAVAPMVLIGLLTIGTNTFGDAVARVSMGAAGRSGELELASEVLGGITTQERSR